MLEGALGIVLGMAREMDLAVFPDNLAVLSVNMLVLKWCPSGVNSA